MSKLMNNLFNPGTINLGSKLGAKGAFFIFSFYLINVLSVEDLARYALFYATLRILTFFGVNSTNITRFDELRAQFTGEQTQTGLVGELLMSVVINHVALYLITLPFFPDVTLITLANIAALVFSVIRLLADFSRFDGKVSGSIWIEDVCFTLVFILLSVFLLTRIEALQAVTAAIVIAGFCGTLCGILVFRKKMQAYGVRLKREKPRLNFRDFLLNTEFSILKGLTVFTMYAFRFFGMRFYGDQMVAETHVLLQQFNMFSLVSISIISGFQSKIVRKAEEIIDRPWLKSTYKTVQFPTLCLSLAGLFVFFIFAENVLKLIAPEFAYLVPELRITIGVIALFLIFNPLFYLFFMNKKVAYRRRVTVVLYAMLGLMISLGNFIENWRIWFFGLLGLLVLFPLVFSVISLMNLRPRNE